MKAEFLKAGDIIRNTGELVKNVEVCPEKRWGPRNFYTTSAKKKVYLELEKNGKTRIAMWNPATEIQTANIKV